MTENIALLGISGSGKTNFISEAIKDINSFSPKITITCQNSARAFGENSINTYMLKAYENIQWNFSICDYNGNLLKSHEKDNCEVRKYFNSSNMWIIFIDGEYFNEENKDEIIGKIKRKTTRIIFPYISDYADKHGEKAPKLFFVVTKARKIINTFDSESIKEVIMASFEGLPDQNLSSMIMLSDTSYTRSAGLALLSLFYMNNLKRYSKVSSESSVYQVTEDIGLKYLGTCVQCLIDNNKKLMIKGFDKINYKYDKSTREMGGSDKFVTLAIVLDLFLIALFLIYLIINVGFADVAVGMIALAFYIALAIGIKNKIARVIFGICSLGGLINLCALSGENGLLISVGFIIWLLVSIGYGVSLDKKTDKKLNIKKQIRFRDELVHFFDTKAKEKNNGK